jgi:signal recognition particle receptor subunit beta
MDEWIRQTEVWVHQTDSWIRQQPPEQIYVAAAVVAVTILLLIVGAVRNLRSFCSVSSAHGLESL